MPTVAITNQPPEPEVDTPEAKLSGLDRIKHSKALKWGAGILMSAAFMASTAVEFSQGMQDDPVAHGSADPLVDIYNGTKVTPDQPRPTGSDVKNVQDNLEVLQDTSVRP